MAEEQQAKIINEGRRGFLARSSAWPVGMLMLPLAGCGDGDGVVSSAHAQDASQSSGSTGGAGYTIDRSIQSPNQDSRVRTLVLHYTAQTLADSLASLTSPQRQVSSHYLVPDAADDGQRFKVFELVPEARRAWHAGVSYWQGDRMLNAGSVGIEIVNLGFPPEDENLPLMNRRWYSYPDAQVAVFGALAADVVARHQVLPHKVVGHSDVAPGRKTDPGPLFPWKKLYDQYKIGAWPEAEAVDYYRTNRPFSGDVASLQSKLLAYGYDTPQTGTLDAQTVNVVSAFQMHFRPSRYDGAPDVETVAILDALLEKYFNRSRAISKQVLPGATAPAGEKGSDVWPLAPASPR
ncbi:MULTISPECIES: N-acetylmuramoyl-L-alanine amidase [Burkholderia]|uniref:N-acetylmuramoyl-L-alanine amidase n=1 Tax=Burkholderia savannae TaxID=1637837 RepID=A0ABR5T312_9BURK|nr:MULTISPECIES: N-acetylmuramoyl-L-alanine amidase [Burkholderia]AOJ73021.1 N-acetylmuramoyl-L-alanine amidase [Burkholderia savannae]KGS02178.1 N-acetylmuramoyl-L-alanine amidase family protein [Burkholderia sp. ABCPW 111]KVG46950.1 N-acetylmuramoyl-L-alanine amidase [Burkholderia sp. MSMB0265]KVG85232.1 N-acetylmuramoyl-L-alanine amidase [Burkholderia sp. MSMB2040]KVG91024.1 N-acetylmuramoyl-L-alanine amidase [Burkholderia sp. MSMB2041]